jgi:site-specific recombinase XerD
MRRKTELGVKSEYVFTYQGRQLKDNIKVSLRRVLNEAGLENVTPHTLRHTFASQLVMAGVSLMDVKELIGHQSYGTTLQYAHLAKDHVKKQVLKLPYANG